MSSIFSVSDDVKNYFKQNYIAGDNESLQKVLLHLKEMGYSQMQCAFLLMKEAGFNIKDADKAVLKTWG